MFVDTHTHLYLDEFQPSPGETVKRAIDAGVERMIFPNVDLSTIGPMKRIHDEFPRNTYMAMGLHPTEIGENWAQDIREVKAELESETLNYVAIGEIGIDLYWDKTFRAQQMDAFAMQVDWATELELPIIIHCREGLDEVLTVLKANSAPVRGVFHSFGGSCDDIRRIREVGDFYFGINGIVTFKNSKLGDSLAEIGIDRILLETDSPYLAPVPFRGKRNESSYIIHTAQRVADIMNLSLDEVGEATTANAISLFTL